MKKMLKTLLFFLLVGAVLFGATFGLNACDFFDCNCFNNCAKNCGSSKTALEPGTYSFEKSHLSQFLTYDAYLSSVSSPRGRTEITDVEHFNFFEKCTGLSVKYTFQEAQNAGNLTFKFSPRQRTVEKRSVILGCKQKEGEDYLIFDNCFVTVEVTVNDVTETFNIPINSTGHTTYTCTVPISTTYEVKGSYKIVSCEGEVFSPASASETLKYGDYVLQYVSNNGQEYYRIIGFNNNVEVLYIYDAIDVGTGQVPIRDVSSIFSYDSTLKQYPGETQTKTKTIVIRGDIDINELAGDWAMNERASGVHPFKNVENIVIEHIHGTLEKRLTFHFPEHGVNVYVNDDSDGKAFVEALQQSSFVNGIYAYEDYAG